ncbi:FAD-binding dehydrogenase [Brevibacterium luteolum]|uniref:FAD-binding dehydrogenase n=1 Tax=Brevibacterium luteolum TaxID=199591 RepID=UPI0021B028EB|nr:FAD-binding dehydrogenase [Brevibacterium luteolum]MCT1829136.1 FAD-binding dehydrogenase [Brevibacterium luteolum]
MHIVVIGSGLAGLVAATEACASGATVTLVDQESENNLGGQAYWSFGGLFLIDSPEQRRMGIRDSRELAHRDWMSTAGFDESDVWPRRWAEAYLEFAAGEKRAWLAAKGHRLFPIVGWAERGDGRADGHGNSVPRFHITWGTGPGVVEPFLISAKEHVRTGRLIPRFRHKVTELTRSPAGITGVAGHMLADDPAPRGRPTTSEAVGDFSIAADAVIIASGGIGGRHELVRSAWPTRLGAAPESMLTGVPAYVDGSMFPVAQAAGAHIHAPDRMWHYVEGIRNWNPIWPGHGIRILPGPSSLWLDAAGNRLPAPNFPGFDTLGTLGHLRAGGHEHSWFILNERIISKEFALSGSEQNPDLTGRSVRKLAGRLGSGPPGPVADFLRHGEDFLTAATVPDLVGQMNRLEPDHALDAAAIGELIAARDDQLANGFGKDAQLAAIRDARGYRGDRLMRTAAPHRLTDPAAGPLIAVRLRTLTRKTLGGLHTDLDARVLDASGTPISGLFAAGEAAGFGGGGMHGHRSLEGTFLGGCLFSGRVAGRAAAHG